ncbi:MAG: hypothetical protein JWQ79_2454 [Mucilaginibacter sp.]|nr:hypothetical protein [Mucilaginibacter sp.]
MIKRLGSLFLTKLYIVTVLGFVINLHYCGKVLAAVSVNSPAKVCKGFSVPKKCCQDKGIDIKIKDARQGGGSSSFLSGLFSFELPKIPFGDFVLSAQQALLEKLSNPAPPLPPPNKTDPVIKNRILRI